jgi:RNA recognition motif-containing protein
MNIHVGNLPLDCTEAELRTLFETCGRVESLEIITNIRSNQPLGYGFIVMATEEEGKRCIDTLNGTTFKGKVLAVERANRPQGKRRFSPRKPRFR